MTKDPRRDVDELRDELRALGYLEARVDRYVLGRAGARRGATSLAIGAAARLGVLAGILLGPAAAVGLRWRVPGLVASATDALVLALYLSVFFGIALAVAAALAMLAGSVLARRLMPRPGVAREARAIALAAGLIVALASLFYLALWWRTATGFAGANSLTGNILAAAMAVATSALLGHGVTVTVLALVGRLSATPGPDAPGRIRSTPSGSAPTSSPVQASGSRAMRLWPLGTLVIAGALLVLIMTTGAPADAAAPPALTVIPSGQRVLVVAIDGVDVATLDRLRASGGLAGFSRFLEQSVATLSWDADRDPARVWTTIATGQPPDHHGIRGLEAREVAGLEGRLRTDGGAWKALTTTTDLLRLTSPTVVSGNERVIPAFWEVAARAGLRTKVVHWWATWPAPTDLGVVISDRAILRLEQGDALDAEIAPAALYDELRASWAARRIRAAERARAALPAAASPDLGAMLRRSAELDATIVDLVEPAADLDLSVVYLPGLDIAQHALFPTAGGAEIDLSAAAERVAVIDAYYRYLDQLLVTLADMHTVTTHTLVLVTQPGRVTRPGAGLLAVTGTPASGGRSEGKTTAVAPTILQTLGVPIARDLAEGPATTLLSPAFLAKHAVRTVTTYGSRQNAIRNGAGRPLDREMIDRMRSLGYLR